MNNLLDNSIRFLKRNSSTILTCVGAVGVAATAIMAAKDTIKATELVKKKEGTDVKLSKKEKRKGYTICTKEIKSAYTCL